jgi:hypothetical protein
MNENFPLSSSVDDENVRKIGAAQKRLIKSPFISRAHVKLLCGSIFRLVRINNEKERITQMEH